MRCLFKAFLMMLVLALLLGGAAYLRLPQKGMVTLIRQATAKWYTGNIVLEDVQIESPTSIVLKNFLFQTADGKENILSLPTIRVELALTRFFRGIKAVEAITFEDPKLSLKRDGSGRLVLQNYVRGRKRRKPEPSPKPKPKTEAGKVPVQDDPGLIIRIRKGRVHYKHPRILVTSLREVEADLVNRKRYLVFVRCRGRIPAPLGLSFGFQFKDITIDKEQPHNSPGIPLKARIVLYIVADLLRIFRGE